MSGSVLSSNEIKDVNKLIIDKLIEANKKSGRVLDPETDIEPIEIKNWQGEFQNPGKYDILFTSKAKSNFVGTATGKIILKPDTRTPITTPNPKFIKLQQPEMTDANAKDFIKTIIDDFSKKNKNIKPSEYEVGGKFNDGEEVMGIENIFKKGSKPGSYFLTFYAKANSKEFKGKASQKYLVEGDFREIVKDFSLKFQMLGPYLNQKHPINGETTTKDIQEYVNDQLNKKYQKLDADISNNKRVIYDWSAIEGKTEDDKVKGIVEIPYKIKFEEGVDNGSAKPEIPYKGNAKIKIDLVPVAKESHGNPTIKRDLKLDSYFFSGLEEKGSPWNATKGTSLRKLWDFLTSETNKLIPGFTDKGAYIWSPWQFERIKEWPFLNNTDKVSYEFDFSISPNHQTIADDTSIKIDVTLTKPQISINLTDSVQRKYNDMYFNPYKVMLNADWDMLVNRPPGLDGSDNGKINPTVYVDSPIAKEETQPGSGYKSNPRDYPKTDNWNDEQIGNNNWKMPSGYSFNDFINIERDKANNKKIVTMKPFERVVYDDDEYKNRGSFKNGEVDEKAVNYFLAYYITLLVFRFKSYIKDIAGFVPNFGGVYSHIIDKPILGGGYNTLDFALHIPSKLTKDRGEFDFLSDSWLTNEYLIGQNTKEDIANDWSWEIDGKGVMSNENYPNGIASHEPAHKFLREKHIAFANIWNEIILQLLITITHTYMIIKMPNVEVEIQVFDIEIHLY